MSGIHLFVPMLHRRDAVGEHTLALRDRLVEPGSASTIYIEIPDPTTADRTRPYLEYESEAEPGDVLVYQFATQSVMAGWLAARPEPVVINYHSITPPAFFGPWNNGITRLQVGGPARAGRLAPRAALGIAVSRFDAARAARAGCARDHGDPRRQRARPADRTGPGDARTAALAGTRARAGRWLSVGRLAPNKAHHHTIAALFVARASPDPGARLTLVGSPSEPAYAARPPALRGRRWVWPTRSTFVSGISDAELAAHYRHRRRAGHAVGARGIRRAPGRGHGPRAPDRGLRRRRGERGARRRRGPARPRSTPGRWPTRCPG